MQQSFDDAEFHRQLQLARGWNAFDAEWRRRSEANACALEGWWREFKRRKAAGEQTSSAHWKQLGELHKQLGELTRCLSRGFL